MKKIARPLLLNYGASLLMVLLAATVLSTSRWGSDKRYTTPGLFAGYYRDDAGSCLELQATGLLKFSGRAAGNYRVIAPVGGKHGYLVEASNLKLRLEENRVVAISGTGGFLWPISKGGRMTVIFTPGTQRELRKGAC